MNKREKIDAAVDINSTTSNITSIDKCFCNYTKITDFNITEPSSITKIDFKCLEGK